MCLLIGDDEELCETKSRSRESEQSEDLKTKEALKSIIEGNFILNILA